MQIYAKALKGCSLFIIAMLMAVTAAGCTRGDSQEAAPNSNDRPVISIMAPLHFPHPPIPELVQEIEKRTNTKLELNWVPDGIYTDKMNTALTTNSLKKATYVKYTDYMLMKNPIRSGAFWISTLLGSVSET